MAITGVFYGVGIGPGDPELITVKAVHTLQRCPVIAAPRTANGNMLALDIARQAVDLGEKTILPLDFTMAPDPADRQGAHRAAARAIARELAAGRDVAMLNLGDVALFSTFGHLKKLLTAQGFDTVMVPGVPSFCAIAARLGETLTDGDTPLHVLTAADADLDNALRLPGTKVLMKSGRTAKVRQALEEQGLLDHAALVTNCGLPGEAVCPGLEGAPDRAGYFSTIVVKE